MSNEINKSDHLMRMCCTGFHKDQHKNRRASTNHEVPFINIIGHLYKKKKQQMFVPLPGITLQKVLDSLCFLQKQLL